MFRHSEQQVLPHTDRETVRATAYTLPGEMGVSNFFNLLAEIAGFDC